MKRDLLIGFLVGIAGIVTVVGLAFGLVRVLNSEDGSSASRLQGHCCRKLKISGASNTDDFYQEMMGDYFLYENNTHLNFTEAKHEIVRNIQFPVYRHVMYQNDPEVSAPKNAFLYYYYNMESRKKEEDCPEGCWIISMYDMR